MGMQVQLALGCRSDLHRNVNPSVIPARVWGGGRIMYDNSDNDDGGGGGDDVEDDDVEDDDVEEEDRSQDLGPHFARACPVEMHVNMSQEPAYTEIYRRSARAQNLGAHFVRACAGEIQVNMSQEPL